MIGNFTSLLENSQEKSGFILYSSQIPSNGDGSKDISPETVVATDLIAFRGTANRQYCGLSDPYPTTSMRWGLLGLRSALKPFSWELEGLVVYIKSTSGKQIIYIASPRSKSHLGNILAFPPQDVPGIPDGRNWEINGYCMEPGSIW